MILVYNSCIKITNYKKNDCPRIEKALSVWDPNIFSYSWRNYFYDEENETLIIPRGISFNYLKKVFPEEEVEYNNDSSPIAKAVFVCNTKPKDETQQLAIDFLTSQNDYDNLKYKHQRMLCLKTGGGKTYSTINAISKYKQRAIIIVDREKTIQQWKDEFKKFTNLSDEDIYIIAGSSTIKKIINSNVELPYKIYIASHRTISSYAENSEEKWNSITKFFDKIKVGIKVYDEAHVEWRNIFYIDSFSNVENTFYLTATPGRSNHNEDKVYQLAFGNIPTFGLEDKSKEPYHYVYYVDYNSKPAYTDQMACQSNYGFNINRWSDYIFNQRYDMFIDILTYLLNVITKYNGKIAIIVHKNEHIKKLFNSIPKICPNKSVGIFSTIIEDTKERNEQLNADIIISTEKSFGKALNVSGLQFLIMTVPTSSKIVTEQMIGRLRKLEDKKCFYFDLTDCGFKQCVIQKRSRSKILNEKAKKIKNLTL